MICHDIVRIPSPPGLSTKRRRIAAKRKDDAGITHLVVGDAD